MKRKIIVWAMVLVAAAFGALSSCNETGGSGGGDASKTSETSETSVEYIDPETLKSWFSCKECEIFAEVVGIAVLAACIYANPGGTAAMEAYKTIYAAYSGKYGSHSMDMDEFILRSKHFVGFGSAAWFVIHYPRFVCCLFGKCSCDGDCSCT